MAGISSDHDCLQRPFYNVFCSMTVENKRHRKSISRLVYHHFVEEFDQDDRRFVISYKDGDSLNVNYKNLEKITKREKAAKSIRNNRAQNPETKYQKPVSQYTVEGSWIADFENITIAGETAGIGSIYILAAIKREILTAGGFRWFLQGYSPKKEDFIVASKSNTSRGILNKPLWERLGRPDIDKNDPPPCMNLSLEDFPGEQWKPILGFEHQYLISNMGRVKRLGSWTSNKKAFWKEQIMAIMAEVKSGKYYFYILPNIKGKRINITITRVLYYCFVEEFDMSDKTLAVVNQSEPLWDLDISKLSLRHTSSFFEGGESDK